MSLWSDYLKERLDQTVIETEDGFIVYRIQKPFCRIEELYVKPDKRKSGVAWRLADIVSQIALEAECDALWAQVGVFTANSSTSLKVVLAYGFELAGAEKDRIILVKMLREV